jgi:hypothetical protein
VCDRVCKRAELPKNRPLKYTFPLGTIVGHTTPRTLRVHTGSAALDEACTASPKLDTQL